MRKGFNAGGLRVVRARGLHFIELAGWERAWSAGCRRSGDYGFAGVYGWAECAATDAAEVLWLQAGGSLDALTAPTVHELAHFARVA